MGAAVYSSYKPVSIQTFYRWQLLALPWSQTLTFEHSLEKKLNAKAAQSILDIRFSTAQWQRLKQLGLNWQQGVFGWYPSCLGSCPQDTNLIRTLYTIKYTLLLNAGLS